MYGKATLLNKPRTKSGLAKNWQAPQFSSFRKGCSLLEDYLLSAWALSTLAILKNSRGHRSQLPVELTNRIPIQTPQILIQTDVIG